MIQISSFFSSDLYTSCVTNFVGQSPLRRFEVVKDVLPHESPAMENSSEDSLDKDDDDEDEDETMEFV
jgi:hypothetical protein